MRTKTDVNTYLVMSVFLLGMAGSVQARTITVGHGADYDFNTIQAAINAATHGDTVVVADGTYKGLGNRDIDFNGKAITVRSENGPELTIIDCNGSSSNEHRGFYFHSGEHSNSVLQGFTITNGYVIDTHGGGIWCEYSSPVVTNCILSNNTARRVTTGVSAFGGGMCNRYNSSPTVTNCTFAGNSGFWGGGMWNGIGSSPTVANCRFIGNGGGGGMSNTHDSSPIVTSCTFIGNSGSDGGGMSNIRSSNSIIINCTFSGNTAKYYGGGIWNRGSSTILTNCILWGNTARGSTESKQVFVEGSPAPTVGYCCVQGWTGALGGIGNIGDNPLLAPDRYHLQYTSPCKNAGDPTGDYHGQTDIDGEPRVMRGRVDIGADEYEPATLVGLEIMGPNEVAENFSASYKAIVYFDNHGPADVTGLVNWSVEPNTYANVDENGMLTTKDIVRHRWATILASYTDGDVTVDAEKPIHIFPICPTGTALQFDGVNDYAVINDNDSLHLSTFTISAWIYKASNTDYGGIVSKADVAIATNHNYNLRESLNGKIETVVYSGTTKTTAVSTNAVSTNQWHHITGTYDGSNLRLYIDGSEAGTAKPTGTSNIGSVDVYIGIAYYRGHALNDRAFDGKIDEVAIYNRALSADEIRANMHRRLVSDEPNLVGYWDFDEGGGQIVYDLSGNGNDGQLGSTPSPDASDPAWVDSDAPIGVCSLYQIATMAIDRAVERKTALLEELLAALAEEWTAYEALEELFESGDYGDLNKGDIVTAKQKIHSATQHQEQTIDALEKSIEKLKDALNALKLPTSNQPPNVTITNPQEGAVFTPSETIEIGANAWDVDGSVVKVEFFANGNKIGEDNDGTDGWKTNWYDLPVGTYSLTAKATDNDGAATTSPAVGITVVELPPPGQASNPHPADGATGIAINANLSWTAGSNAVSHNVYFGTTSPGTFRGNQTATTFDPGTMVPGKTYYWRIDEVNPGGTTTGTVWSFRTSSGPPPPPM